MNHLGSFVVEKLMQRGCGEVFVSQSHEYGLSTIGTVRRLHDDAAGGYCEQRRLVHDSPGVVPACFMSAKIAQVMEISDEYNINDAVARASRPVLLTMS